MCLLLLLEYRETYTKHKRTLLRQYKIANGVNLDASRVQLEKDYKTAMQKQDQKIELAMRMYDLVSRHIERLDSQVVKSGLSESEWIKSSRKGPNWHENSSKSHSLLLKVTYTSVHRWKKERIGSWIIFIKKKVNTPYSNQVFMVL